MKFLIDNWMLISIALASGGMLVWPMVAGGMAAGGLNAAGAVQLINREKAVVVDVSDAQQVKAAVATVEAAFGHITVLLNHAGILSAVPFLDTSEEEWDRIMAVNVKSMFLVTRAVLPGMLAAGGGSIVCTSSISAVVGTPMEVLYCTSKGATHMFARAIAVEFRDRGIRANAICPGFIATAHGLREIDMLRKHGVDVSEQAIAAAQGRLCQPAEVASAALFLASDDASFVNGAHLFADNGYTAV